MRSRILFAGRTFASESCVYVVIVGLLTENQSPVCWRAHCMWNGCISFNGESIA